jgi:endogenous inhibitor of DNA gyrase (YacG/DUF329 family)
MLLACPICGKKVESVGNAFRPFCSERCKLLDLGNWIDGRYRVPTNSVEEDEDGTPALQDEDSDSE